MPIDSGGWVPTTTGEYLISVRADYEAAIGTVPVYSGSLDGAWTVSAASLANDVDNGGALAYSALRLATCPTGALVARAIEAGITPRAATSSTASGVVTAGASGTMVVGSQVEGGGEDGRARWALSEIDGNTTSGANVVVSGGEAVVLTAVDTGAVTLPTGTVVLPLVNPVPGVESVTYVSSTDDFTVGQVAETDAELRVRVEQARARVGGSLSGMRSALIDLSWVLAANIAESAGNITVTVAPGPVGSAQAAELGDTIYATKAGGAVTNGAESVSVTGVNGTPVTVYYEVGSTEDVAVVYTLTSDGSVSAADMESAADAAILAEFTGLDIGGTVYYHRVYSSLDLPGVIGVSLTLNGGTSDVTPASAADVLVASPITGTIS